MQSTVEALEGNKIRINVNIDDVEFERNVEEAFRKLARQVRVPGFRPGKAPRRVLEAQLGDEGRRAARAQAIEDAVPMYLTQAVREHRIDLTPRPVMLVMVIVWVLVVMMHRDDRASGGDTATLCALERERVVVHGQRRKNGTDHQLIGTRVDERGQGHVAGGARRTIEPGHPRHGVQPRTMRATAQAAPYPLSMPTTVMPLAQVACMASNAVTPSSPDP